MKRLLSSKFLWTLIIFASLAGIKFFGFSNKAQSLHGGAVTKGELIQRVTVAGLVVPNRKTVISAPYNGYVRKIYVQVGDRVNAGDPIVSIAQSLKGSVEEVFPMRAPFSGTVVQVLKTEGEYVEQQNSQGGSAIVRIDDLSRLYIEANSPETEVGKLKIGQEVVIKASAIVGTSYKGKIQKISLAAREQKDWDKSRVEFSVNIQVSGNDTLLKPGMSVIVDIITNKLANILTLRHEFIQKNKDQYFVVTDMGVKKNIEVGLQNEEAFEVRWGLKEGDRVQQTDFLSLIKDQ